MSKTATDKNKKKLHPGWGGARANSGGPRPGSGRPNKFGTPVEHYDVRIPPAWHAAIKAHGKGNFTDGLAKILRESGVVG